MITLQSYIDQKRAYFNLPASGKISCVLRGPWRRTNTGRCLYFVRMAREDSYRLVIQETTTMQGKECLQNVYQPQFSQDIQQLLHPQTGRFSIGLQSYYWCGFYDTHSLLDDILNRKPRKHTSQDSSNLRKVAETFLELQTAGVHNNTGWLPLAKEMILEKIAEQPLIDLYLQKTAHIWQWLSQYENVPCSWGHGALWPKDVFIINNQVKAIDWEWAIPTAPLGSDIVNFYFSCAEHIFDIPFNEIPKAFIGNQISGLSAMHQYLVSTWRETEMCNTTSNAVIVFTLLRKLARLLAEDGYPTALSLQQHISAIQLYMKNPFVYH